MFSGFWVGEFGFLDFDEILDRDQIFFPRDIEAD